MRTGIGTITIYDISDGITGMQGASVTLYILSATTPTVPSTVSTYSFSTGEVTGIGSWSTSMPSNTESGGIIWSTHNTALASASTSNASLDPDDWSEPEMILVNGTTGEDGKHGSGSYIVTNVDEDDIPDDAGKDDDILSLAGRDAQEGDILTYTDTDETYSTQYLRGESTWEEFSTVLDGSAIVNGTLAAEKLQANTITGDKIVSNVSLDAPVITAGTGSFTGAVTASSGSFTGTVYASDGEFTGRIESSTISSTVISGGTVEGSTILGGLIYGATFYAGSTLVTADPTNTGSSLLYEGESGIPVGASEEISYSAPSINGNAGSNASYEYLNFYGFTCAYDNKLPFTTERSAYTKIPANTFTITTTGSFKYPDRYGWVRLHIDTIDRSTGAILSTSAEVRVGGVSYDDHSATINHNGLIFDIGIPSGTGTRLTITNREGNYGSAVSSTQGYLRFALKMDYFNGTMIEGNVYLDNLSPIVQ